MNFSRYKMRHLSNFSLEIEVDCSFKPNGPWSTGTAMSPLNLDLATVTAKGAPIGTPVAIFTIARIGRHFLAAGAGGGGM